MPAIRNVQSLTFSTGETSTGIDTSYALLGNSFEYSSDDNVATFIANISPDKHTTQELHIKLLDSGNNVLAHHHEMVSSARISFLVDIDDLAPGSFTAQVEFATADEIGSGGITLGGSATVSFAAYMPTPAIIGFFPNA